VSATRLCYLKEDGEELLPGLSRDLLLFFAILRCAFISQVSCQGEVEMGGDMFQRYAVRVTMTAITAELKEYAQGWCWRWRGGTR
jgi:hypothetical protein